MATMDTKAVVPLLVAMMLLTGVCNTLLTKYQVFQKSTDKAHAASLLTDM